MNNRQLIFNLLVGFTLIGMGTAISAQASVGTALVAIGIALIALTAATKSAAYFTENKGNVAVQPAIAHQATEA